MCRQRWPTGSRLNPIYGRTNNPHDRDALSGRIVGRFSAAAIAMGFSALEIGIRHRGVDSRAGHAFCGVYGHKSELRPFADGRAFSGRMALVAPQLLSRDRPARAVGAGSRDWRWMWSPGRMRNRPPTRSCLPRPRHGSVLRASASSCSTITRPREGGQRDISARFEKLADHLASEGAAVCSAIEPAAGPACAVEAPIRPSCTPS
jgi:hypothetical protein